MCGINVLKISAFPAVHRSSSGLFQQLLTYMLKNVNRYYTEGTTYNAFERNFRMNLKENLENYGIAVQGWTDVMLPRLLGLHRFRDF